MLLSEFLNLEMNREAFSNAGVQDVTAQLSESEDFSLPFSAQDFLSDPKLISLRDQIVSAEIRQRKAYPRLAELRKENERREREKVIKKQLADKVREIVKPADLTDPWKKHYETVLKGLSLEIYERHGDSLVFDTSTPEGLKYGKDATKLDTSMSELDTSMSEIDHLLKEASILRFEESPDISDVILKSIANSEWKVFN